MLKLRNNAFVGNTRGKIAKSIKSEFWNRLEFNKVNKHVQITRHNSPVHLDLENDLIL